MPLFVAINDFDFDLIARNIIMLLTLLVVGDAVQAADCVLHIWYSTMIRPEHLSIIQGPVLELVRDVCSKVSHKQPHVLSAKTFKLAGRGLRVVLTTEQWMALPEYFDVPAGLTATGAISLFRSIVANPERVDYVDRALFKLRPHHRVGMVKFREAGILVPFGSPRHQFTVPNPTFFQNPREWPMRDSCDPFDSRNPGEIYSLNYGPAARDVYGKLHYFLQDQLMAFHGRLRSLDLSISVFCMNAVELPSHLGGARFSRIETSNIADINYVGLHRLLPLFGRLLQSAEENPSATMLTLNMNAVAMWAELPENYAYKVNRSKLFMRILPFMKTWGLASAPSSQNDAGLEMAMSSIEIMEHSEEAFKCFLSSLDTAGVAGDAGLEMKREHTIVDKWPAVMKLKHGQKGAQEEFDLLVGSSLMGTERYTEWKRRV